MESHLYQKFYTYFARKNTISATDQEIQDEILRITNWTITQYMNFKYAGRIPSLTSANALAEYMQTTLQDFLENRTGRYPKLVYLAGPVSNPDDPGMSQDECGKMVARRFELYERYLNDRHYAVMNPVRISSQMPLKNMTYDHLIRIGLAELAECDLIAIQPGWERSNGCRIELEQALKNGQECMFLPSL